MNSESWLDRTVKHLVNEGITEEGLKLSFEAYVEMKCVALKIALARCYEIIYTAENNKLAPSPDDTFSEEIMALFK